MPGDPRECLEHANNCLRLAAHSNLREDKAIEDLARIWLYLAGDLVRTAALLKYWDKQRITKR
jgi:hypothetical protein